MKKQFVLIATAVAALFAVSCVKENPVENAPVQGAMKEVTISASIDDATKTSYDAEGKFSWSMGDQISVLADNGTFYTFTATESGATATFTGTIPAQAELEHAAFFPADPEHAFVAGVAGAEDASQYDSYYYNVPEYKDLSVVPSAGLPMGSYNSEGYVFTHMTGAALFTFTNIHEDFTAVEVSFSQALKFNGKFKTYVSNGVWSYFGAANATKGDPEASYTRKVKVENGKAKAYLPYPIATLWSGLTIDIKGIKADGSEVSLLSALKTKQHIVIADRTTIIPITPIALPDYVPAADLQNVNWDGATSLNIDKTSSAPLGLTDVKAYADNNYLYLKVVAPSDLDWDRLYIGLASGIGDMKPWWQWTTTGAVASQQYAIVTAESISFTYNDVEVPSYVVEAEGSISWSLAIPRTGAEFQGTQSVSFGVMAQKGGDTFICSAPARSGAMVEIALP